MDTLSIEAGDIPDVAQEKPTDSNPFPTDLPDLVHADVAKQNACVVNALINTITEGGINAVNLFNITLIACGVSDQDGPIKSRDIYNKICSKGILNLVGMSYKIASLTIATASDFVKFAKAHLISNISDTRAMTLIPRPPLLFLKATANTIALEIFKTMWGVGERDINMPSREDFKTCYAMTDVNNYSSKLDIVIIKLLLEKIKSIQPFGQDDILTHTVRKDDCILINNVSSKTMYCMVADCYELFASVYTSALPTLPTLDPGNVQLEPEISSPTPKNIQRSIDKTKRIGNKKPSI